MSKLCHFCGKEHNNNRGTIYNNEKIYVCNKCRNVTIKCCICGKDIIISFKKENKDALSCKSCGIKKSHRTMKNNKTGIYNLELNKKRIEKQKLNKTGFYDLKIQKEIHRIQKENKIGIYDPEQKMTKLSKTPEAIAKWITTNKKNKTGVFNKEHQLNANRAAVKSNKENKTGFFNKEIQKRVSEAAHKILKLNIKNFLSLNTTINLFLGDSFDKIITADYSSFSDYNNIPGIWAIWGENLNGIKICLDVCQTKDIGNEMRLGLRKLVAQKQNKYKNFTNYKNIIFIPIKLDILEFKDRELLEAFYAIKNNSLYWSPSPSQLKLIKLSKEELYRFIEKYNNSQSEAKLKLLNVI